MRRVPASTERSSISAPAASSGGWQSPAGEAAPRLPPIVPRLRICGEPTVRAASARPGNDSRELAQELKVGRRPRRRAARRRRGSDSRELGDPGEVEDRLGTVAVEVELDHHVGAAGERQALDVAAHDKRLLEVSRAQHLHAQRPFRGDGHLVMVERRALTASLRWAVESGDEPRGRGLHR